MKARLPLLVALALVLGADQPKDRAKGELEKLQGKWTMVSSTRNGEKVPDEQIKAFERTIKGDHMEVTRDGELVAKGTIKIDVAKKPFTIDVTFMRDDGEGSTVKGIYELNGNEQRICYGGPGVERPTKFESSEGVTLSVWKKASK